jgi:prevent-host-death family protein
VKVVNMHEAKTTLSQLVEQVENGEEVVLARAGRPVARIVAIPALERRRFGQWKGRVRMSDDFDASLPDVDLAAWSGESS